MSRTGLFCRIDILAEVVCNNDPCIRVTSVTPMFQDGQVVRMEVRVN